MAESVRGKAVRSELRNNGKTAPQRKVRLNPNLWMAHQAGHCTMGLVMVAQLICQANVASLHVGKTCLALEEIRRCQYAIWLWAIECLVSNF